MDRPSEPPEYQPPAIVDALRGMQSGRFLLLAGWVNALAVVLWVVVTVFTPSSGPSGVSLGFFCLNLLIAVIDLSLAYRGDAIIGAIERGGRRRHAEALALYRAEEDELAGRQLRRHQAAREALYGVTSHRQRDDVLWLECRSFDHPTHPAVEVEVPVTGAQWLPTDRAGTVATFPAAMVDDDDQVMFGDRVVLMSHHNQYNLPDYQPAPPATPAADDLGWLRQFE
jgi:hypothetical protein